MNYNPLDDEEERKRREAIAARMDEEAMANPVGPVNPSFLDTAGQYIGNRFDQAMNRVSQAGDALMNPQQALQQRMFNEQRQQEQEDAANAEVKTQTVKTYGDGSQEQVVKTQIPAQQAQPAQQPQLAQPQLAQPAAQPGMAGAVPPNDLQAQQQAQMVAEETARAQQNRGLTAPIPGMPQNLPAQGQIPAQAAQQAPQMPPMPQPGPQVQVAGATQMPPQAAAPGASLAQAGAQAQTQPVPQPAAQPTAQPAMAAPQPAQPSWVQAANDAGDDFYKLLDVANKNPESRDMIADKIKQSFKQQTLKDEADATMKAAQAGDLKAMNKIEQAIRPEKGKAKEEVTVNDYLKAVLYKRLGLDAMAAEVQNKIIGKNTKFGQVTFNGSNWETETNSQGQIIRAKDDQGNIATESTLNKLRAGAQKFGTQSTSFTGGIHTVPNAQGDGQDLVMPTQNSMTGKAGFTYASGPKQGQPYTGTATPQPQSVGTSFQKALDKAMIDFKTNPSTAGAKSAMEKAYVLDPGDGSVIRATQAQINANSPAIFNEIKNFSPSGSVSDRLPADTGAQGGAQAAPRATAEQISRVQGDIESINRELAQPKPAGFSQKSEDERKAILRKELETRQAWMKQNAGGTAPAAAATAKPGMSLTERQTNIATNAALTEAEGKPPAEARGKGKASDITNQRAADENYALIKPVADLIKQSTGSGIGARVDDLARFFGVGTEGAKAIAALNTMSYPFKYMIPRFEGPQSDRDTNLYVEAAGDFANPKKTQAERLAALQGMVFILKKYDKEGKNDWTYGGTDPSKENKAQPGTTSSGNKYKKVQ